MKDKLREYLLYKTKREDLYKVLVEYPAKKRGDNSTVYFNHITSFYMCKDWIDKFEIGMHIPEGLNQKAYLNRVHTKLNKLRAGFNRRMEVLHNES